MNENKDSQLNAIVLMFRFLFLVFIFILAFFFERLPQLELPTVALLLLIGVFAFVYGMETSKKYKQVMDYEKIMFFGRERNAIQVRKFLQAFGFTGLWFILLGVILLCLSISYFRNK